MVIPNPHTCPARMSRCTLQKLPANAVQFAPNRRPVSATSDVPQDTLTAQIADLTRVGRFPTLKSFTKPITQTEKTRPFWPRDESLPLQRPQSQTSECWNLRRRNKPRTAPHTGNGVTEHRSVLHPAISGETPPWLRHARTMSTWSLVLRADHPERPKPYKADCVRSHDCC
jgi:hypothetical protein